MGNRRRLAGDKQPCTPKRALSDLSNPPEEGGAGAGPEMMRPMLAPSGQR